MDGVHKFLWVMIGIIILLAGYLSAIYIKLRVSFHKMKDKDMIESRKYPCYLNIILSSVIAIDNICRLITNKKSDVMCTIQAFILAVFDKLILTTITVNTYLTYRGLSNNEYYMNNIKRLFIITNSVSLGISLILAIIFVCNGTSDYNVCYVKGGSFKENIDSIVSIVVFCIFLYSNLKSLLFLLKNIKELSLSKNNTLAHLIHFYRMVGSLFLCSMAFLITLLIINDSLFLNDDYIDLCFISICLALDLYYTLNYTVIKQTLIICRFKEEERETDFGDNEENEIEDRANTGQSLDYINED